MMTACRHRLPVILPLLCAACATPDKTIESYLTHTATLSTFRNSVFAVGDLEAKNAHVLTTPRIWPQPEIAFLAPEGTQVDSGAVVVRLVSPQLQRNYDSTLRELEVTRAESEQKEAELNLQRFKLEADLKSAQASLTMAELLQPRLDFVTSGTRRLKKLEMKKTRLNIEKLEKQLTALVDIQKEERTHLELKIKQSQNQIDKARESLDKLELRAPVGGMVLYETNRATGNKRKEGDGVWPMMPIAKIPDMREMQVKLQIGETDTQHLEEGHVAEVCVPALGERLFAGKVARIDKRAKPVRHGN